MIEDSFTAKVVHSVVFLAICVAILSIGWTEPLRYRFMSPQEISALEAPAAPTTPPPTPAWIDRRFNGSSLDDPPRPGGTGSPVRSMDKSRGPGR